MGANPKNNYARPDNVEPEGKRRIESVVALVDSLAPLDATSLADSVAFHGVPLSGMSVIENGWLFPLPGLRSWVLSRP